MISSAVHEDANIIFGAVVEEQADKDIFVTVIATRLQGESSGSLRGYGAGDFAGDSDRTDLPSFIRQHRRTAI